MIKQLSITLLMGVSLMTTACAQDASENTGETVKPATVATASLKTASFSAPDEAWRDVDPENLLLIDTDYGRIGVELYPEISPGHVARIKELTRAKFYDYITFHRVIEGFMNQTGDPKGDGTGDSDLPDLEAEFTFRRGSDLPVTLVGARKMDPRSPEQGEKGVGFYKAMPIATDPMSQAMLTKDGKVKAFGLHCKGVTSMARSNNPNSGNSQFFLMRGTAPHLDAQYTVWGNTVLGHDLLTKPKVGTKGQTPDFIPDRMNKVQIAADVPDAEHVQVLKTDSPAFKSYMKTLKLADGTYPDICDISVPTRIKP